MYIYNYELLNNLSTVLGIKLAYLARRINVPKSTFFYHKKRKDMPLTMLIDICNEVHVPISHFVVLKSDEPRMIGQREDYVVEPFVPIVFRNVDFGGWLTRNRNVSEACKLLGISYRKYISYFHSAVVPPNMMVSDMIDCMNRAEAYPGDFLIDENRRIEEQGDDDKNPLDGCDPANEEGMLAINKLLWQRMEKLMKQNEQLMEQNRILKARINDIELYNAPLRAAEEGGEKYV